jgi:hypothetical protein
VVAKTGDSPCLRIGEALTSGRGLISVVLDLTYQGIVTNTSTIVEYANNAAALTAGLKIGEFYRTGDDLKVIH